MTNSFDADGRYIEIEVSLEGPGTTVSAIFCLDTGATSAAVDRRIAVALGYHPGNTVEHAQVITGSGIEMMPRIRFNKIEALGGERQNFPILCHTFPSGSPFDGLLGLDFFRNQRLTIDFREGLISLD